MLDFDVANVEYEREREKWNLDNDPNNARPAPRTNFRWTWLLLFFAGMVLFRLTGDLLRFLF